MTLDQLQQIFPYAGAMARTFLDPLSATMDEFEIDTPLRAASFLAQIGHESGQLRSVEENLNYSAQALLATFPSHFNGPSDAAKYAHQPVAIANRVYANRMGNGDEASGDGWRYRGMGLIQQTGKENQLGCALYFKVPLEKIGAWLRTPEGATRSSGFFWHANGLNALADKNDQIGVSGGINCGNAKAPQQRINGLADRLALFHKAQEVLK